MSKKIKLLWPVENADVYFRFLYQILLFMCLKYNDARINKYKKTVNTAKNLIYTGSTDNQCRS